GEGRIQAARGTARGAGPAGRRAHGQEERGPREDLRLDQRELRSRLRGTDRGRGGGTRLGESGEAVRGRTHPEGQTGPQEGPPTRGAFRRRAIPRVNGPDLRNPGIRPLAVLPAR